MDFSGFGNNKTFKAGGDPIPPYFYLNASLDLAGAVDGGTYYFNLDNSLAYGVDRDYSRFVLVDDTMVISEVIAFADDDLVAVNEAPVDLLIGGADRLDAVEPYVKVPWAAPAQSGPVLPPGFNGEAVTIADVNNGTVNYYGHEGGHFPYFLDSLGNPDLSKRYKYLAVTVNPDSVRSRVAAESQELKARKKRLGPVLRSLPSGPAVIESGRLTVILKIYPKIRP
jgi:hypothetical protein